MSMLIAMLAICALTTFLLRYVPIYLERHYQQKSLPGWCQVMLNALGPAAMSALVIVSLLPLLIPDQVSLTYFLNWQNLADTLPVLSAILMIWVVDCLSQNVILATFTGVITYGGCLYLLAL